ncbi:hypothetical protein N1851_001764 [Merluccius polli]|uniref:Uncharacterized protein n=1 Tax=Merluccius polli TaxID=89951 RepID=A0AA47NC75_MERPO|nr:hypothetical protein N1851_001764 [Merluccius polli]
MDGNNPRGRGGRVCVRGGGRGGRKLFTLVSNDRRRWHRCVEGRRWKRRWKRRKRTRKSKTKNTVMDHVLVHEMTMREASRTKSTTQFEQILCGHHNQDIQRREQGPHL